MIIAKQCFCGTKNYQHCCGRFIDNKEIPTTPEELMRSRYSAYAQANIKYIQQTMTGPAAIGFDFKTTEDWANTVNWLGLRIIRCFHNENKEQAFVEFIATYKSLSQTKQQLHEISEFRLIDKHWFYYNGKLIMPSINKSSIIPL